MSFHTKFLAAVLFSALAGQVSGHAALTAVYGTNNVVTGGFDNDPNVPRTGSGANPFQRDSLILRDADFATAGPCGKSKGNGNVDVPANMEKLASAGIPETDASGQITMTIHQVNQDGAGPYECACSTDGGQTFQDIEVTKNVPGLALGLSTATAEDFNMTMVIPPTMKCSGGSGANACIVRCRNNTPAGPFGGCAQVTNAGGNNAAVAGGAAAPASQAAAAAANPATPPAAAPKPKPAAAAKPAKDDAAGGLLGKLGGLIPRFKRSNLEARAIPGLDAIKGLIPGAANIPAIPGAAAAKPAAGGAAAGPLGALQGLIPRNEEKAKRLINEPSKRQILSRIAGRRV